VNPTDRDKEWTVLMEQALQGDARAYRRLLELITPALRRAVRGRARTIGVGDEDIVQ